jgi:hypothetical protein
MRSRVVQLDDRNSVADECEWRAIASVGIFPRESASWEEKPAGNPAFCGVFSVGRTQEGAAPGGNVHKIFSGALPVLHRWRRRVTLASPR